ncbi:unnamed protein product [Cyprideis torosa]|uniref:Mitochondrial glutamate carrier 2 n=1 Tax=Cyprideis torosa TaxID=163714 RepID=A0A7R8ZT66_9CRUS|nr:unnamed protein product [Cyprideis torosa]CAG0903281.1 unnamed protein product [Cyprideis torosa]
MALKNVHPKELERTKTFSLVPKIVNGGIAGIIGVTCVFPLDLVKTRLQNQKTGPHGEKMYSSILDCFRKTFKSEGFFGMYRGAAVNIVLITPEKAIKLTGNDYFRHYLRKADGTLPMHRQMVAGGLAGLCQIIVTTPMELLKIQLQDSGRTAAVTSSGKGAAPVRLSAGSIALNLIKEKGIMGLYKGTKATAFRDVSFSIIYFPAFATLNSVGPRKEGFSALDDGGAVFWWSFIAGMVAGSVASLAVTPLDVIKTRLQTIRKAPGDPTYTGMVDAFTRILREEELRAFFKGGASRAIVIAPLFGIAQVVYFLGIAERILPERFLVAH